jgi:hypothetical protein
MNDREFLASKGITHPELQDEAIKSIPCGIETVEEAYEDKTAVDVNSPRALMVCHWKGILKGLAIAQKIMNGEGD